MEDTVNHQRDVVSLASLVISNQANILKGGSEVYAQTIYSVHFDNADTTDIANNILVTFPRIQ